MSQVVVFAYSLKYLDEENNYKNSIQKKLYCFFSDPCNAVKI